MKILQILPEMNVGGVETGTVDLAKYYVQSGHQSFVISNGGRLVEDLERSGTRHFALPVHKKNLFKMLRLIHRVRKIIVDNKIDIVHARSRVPAWIAYFACRGTDASFITTCHGYYTNPLFSQVMGWAKCIIVPSEVIGRHMIDDYHVPAESIRRIPRSVDLDRFAGVKRQKKSDNAKTVAILGRITPLKGHTYFLQAMARVVRKIPYVKVWVIGEAPASKAAYKKDLLALVQRLGLSANVEFLGNRKDIPELLSKIDVLVLSTVTQESFGRVILEAQAMDVPVVATSVGGVVDIIDQEKTGLLVMPKDPKSMADGVIRFLEDRAFSERVAVAARQKINDEFTLDKMASRTLKAYEELLRSMNILIIKISSVGDVILVTGSLKAIREKFPKAKIKVLVGKESRKVLQKCPYIDELIVYDYKENDRGWLGFYKLARRLRKERFDKVIDFQNSKKSHLLSFLCLPRESYGYYRKWGFLLSHPLKKWRDDIAAVPHQFQLLALMGIQMNDPVKLELWPTAKDRSTVDELLDGEYLSNNQNIVGINIAASDNWPTKNWPLEHIANLCDLLAAKNIRVVVTGQNKDRQKAHDLMSLTKAKPANLVGKTDIMELAALIERCKVYITPDSAPLHVAAAVKTPVITMFGPTNSARHLPPGDKITVLDKKLACAPCYSPRCHIITHACMKDITPDEVLKQVMSLMKVKV